MEKKLNTLLKGLMVALMMVTHIVSADDSSSQFVKFSNTTVKMPMPGMMMTAAFVGIENTGTMPLVLIGVKTDFANMSELHGMLMNDGVMQMRKANDGWVIAPGAILILAPGGKHVMLMGLNNALFDQQHVEMQFNFEGKGWVSTTATVKAM